MPGRNQHLNQLENELNEYFGGKLKTFSVPLHTPVMNSYNRSGKHFGRSLMEKPVPIKNRRK